MKTTTGLLLLLSVVAYALTASVEKATKKQSGLPAYIECTSNDDCTPGTCCAIGQDRYTYPRCQPLRAKGSDCRPGNPLLTGEQLYYEDGLVIDLKNVYRNLCPCDLGLVCDSKDGKCREA